MYCHCGSLRPPLPSLICHLPIDRLHAPHGLLLHAQAAEEQKVDTSVSYGLTVHARRQQQDADGAALADTNGTAEPPQQNGHAAAAAAPGGVTSRDWESRVFKVLFANQYRMAHSACGHCAA
jgi:hypothetical protein